MCVLSSSLFSFRLRVCAFVDVLLLSDIFENFRKTAMATYSLDPAHYFTLPGFAWDALLKVSDATLDLLSDIDMHQFIERGMRGAVSMVTRRYAEANNPLCDDYDPEQATVYLQYLDANNLYGWAMCQPCLLAIVHGKNPPMFCKTRS